MKDSIITYVVFTVVLTFFVWIGVMTIDDNERIECHKWQDMSEQYEEFYLLGWQVNQCERHNIAVDAPLGRL